MRVSARVVSPLQQRLALLKLALLVVLLSGVLGKRGALPPRVILDGQRQWNWRLWAGSGAPPQLLVGIRAARGHSPWAQIVALSTPVCFFSGGSAWAAASQGTLSTLVGLELLHPPAPDLALVAGRVWQQLLDRLHLPR